MFEGKGIIIARLVQNSVYGGWEYLGIMLAYIRDRLINFELFFLNRLD